MEKRREQKLAKVHKKLDAYFEEGQFYEAQQLYRTLTMRYQARKQFDTAASLAVSGVSSFLEHSQNDVAGDLGLVLLDLWKKQRQHLEDKTQTDGSSEGKDSKGEKAGETATGLSDQQVELLLSFFAKFPASGEPLPSQLAFMKAAVQLSAELRKSKDGDPRLHLAMAQRLLPRDPAGFNHFLRSGQPELHGKALAQFALAKGLVGERDLFVARAVLQYLCLEDLDAANCVYSSYMAAMQPALDTPLTHFVEFLLETVQRDAAPLFLMLKEKYKISLARDPQFAKYIDKIGELYFGIQGPKGMFENLLASLGA
eukprot:g35314.t1